VVLKRSGHHYLQNSMTDAFPIPKRVAAFAVERSKDAVTTLRGQTPRPSRMFGVVRCARPPAIAETALQRRETKTGQRPVLKKASF